MSQKTVFNVVEANVEIARLTGEVTTSTQAFETLKTTHTAALLEKENAHAAVVQAKEAKITELAGTVTALTGERDAAKAVVAAKDAEIAKLKGTATTVETRAAEIASGIGAKSPLAADPASAGQTGKTSLKDAWGKSFVSSRVR